MRLEIAINSQPQSMIRFISGQILRIMNLIKPKTKILRISVTLNEVLTNLGFFDTFLETRS